MVLTKIYQRGRLFNGIAVIIYVGKFFDSNSEKLALLSTVSISEDYFANMFFGVSHQASNMAKETPKKKQRSAQPQPHIRLTPHCL